MVIPKRMTAEMEGPFCVFLIGMRINRPLRFHKWLPVFFAMPRMLEELRRQPELGFMGGHVWLGRTIVLLQYWKSFGDLTRYAQQSDLAHLPAWARFRRNVGSSGDVGIWHETYLISEGQYESIYHNMPPFGLGRVGQLVEATGHRESAPSGFVQNPNWILAGGYKTSLSSIVKNRTNEASFSGRIRR
jgi:Monooxygenase af470-like